MKGRWCAESHPHHLHACRAAAAAAVASAPTAAPITDDAAAAASNEPICKQTQHAKIIAKGVPEDGIKGIKDKQVGWSGKQ